MFDARPDPKSFWLLRLRHFADEWRLQICAPCEPLALCLLDRWHPVLHQLAIMDSKCLQRNECPERVDLPRLVGMGDARFEPLFEIIPLVGVVMIAAIGGPIGFS